MGGPTIAQVIAGVRQALAKVEDGATALGQAADALEEAINTSDECLVGGSGWDEVVPPIQKARERVLDDLKLCQRVTGLGNTIITTLSGPAPGTAVPPAVATGTATRQPPRSADRSAVPVDPEWSTRARARLPARRPGGQTHGEYVDQDGITHAVVSGTEEGVSTELGAFLGRQRLIPPRFRGGVDTITHVELKVAWRMRTSGTSHLTLAINNKVDTGMYGCHRLLAWVLPTGYTLEVHDDLGKHIYKGKGGMR
ncbi:DddA-like double-stranded DNA deaminase toxin [Crossiella sp. CA198]|uniref:DddA-like double-stranded DNA deaminase toxin n=1 Tax=Crossiella sp. CA198 TaxID=3455607 RepID=UPI003F8D1973